MATFSMKCPMCGDPLVRESEQQAGYGNPAIYCLRTVRMVGNGKLFNHYREEYLGPRKVIMIVPPYRVSTVYSYFTTNKVVSIGTYLAYKTGNKGWHFKTILKLESEIHPDTDENILNRIKLLLLML